MARIILILSLVFLLAFCILCGAERVSDCELPKAVGNCQGRIRSFFFDKQSRECRPFVYSGCGGNGNRFYSREECHFACHYFMRLQPQNWSKAEQH